MTSPDPNRKEPLNSRLDREWNSFKSNVESEWGTFKERLDDPGAWNSTLRKETNEVTDYYLTSEQHERLAAMSRPKRIVYKTGWIFTAIFEKLHPGRRVLAVIGLFFILINKEGNNNALFGGLLLIVVIMLELKDKLVAHDELEAGRKIQQSLMPKRMPAMNGWNAWLYTRAANEVCGDLIDFLRLDTQRYGIAIADVAGKGLHAALITAKLQATLRALAGETRSLPELIGKINSIVHRDSPAKIFSSMLYAECSAENGTVTFVNAGHFPALIKRNDSIEETSKGETALGLSATMKFTQHSTILNNGDLFILYSDGLTEAKNERGEFFGKERLVEILRTSNGTSEQIASAVVTAVDRFVGNTSPSDDLSLIILQRTS